MKIVDIQNWQRKDAYKLFSQLDWPFYSVTFPVEVGNLKEVCKQKGLSFYCAMVWACTKALNSVEAFRMRVRNNQVVVLDVCQPSFTFLQAGQEQFKIVSVPFQEDFEQFCRDAKQQATTQKEFLNSQQETDQLIYFSCLPWFDFTALTNERSFNRDDTIPRLAWGKYFEEGGKLILHLSAEVNHRTIDGYHLHLFKDALDQIIADFKI